MNQPETYPPPVLDLSRVRHVTPLPTDEKWERERLAFYRLLPQLMQTHRGHFVAIHEERVVACGSNVVEVATQAYREHGDVPIYCGWVSDQPVRAVRISGPRCLRESQETTGSNP
jgi:hypothetical protein